MPAPSPAESSRSRDLPSVGIVPRGPLPFDAAEGALLVITCAHLCFLPWALGGMHYWSQVTSLVLALVGFVLALACRRQGPSGNRLVHHPLFYAALAWLAYLAVQALNPAWRYVRESGQWWLEPVPHLSWLPAGVEAPLALSGPWRMLFVHASLLLLGASVWLGFSRRKSYRILLATLAANSLLLASVGFVQRLEGAARIFGMYRASNERFVATFIYPNHAGPYFYLMTAVAAGLAWWSLRRPARPWLGGALVVAAVLSSTMVVQTQSRMSVLLQGFFWAGFVFAAIWRASGRRSAANPTARRSVLIAGALALAIALPLSLTSGRQLWQRFSGSAATETERAEVREATAAMLRDQWLLGWGAGCFRHVFPLYAQHRPAIYENPGGWRKYWEHAHNDWLEFAAELGLLGSLPPAAFLAWLGFRLVRSRCWTNPVSLALFAGGVLPPLHALVDFPWQNPAVLFTWVVLLIAAIRWSELHRPGQPTATPASA